MCFMVLSYKAFSFMSLIDLTAIHLALQFSTTLVQDMKR